jgi:hypothetical protein
MTYLTNISFYLALRANPPHGQDPKTHPVYQVLRDLTEVIRSLEHNAEGRVDEGGEEVDDEEEFKNKKKRSKKSKKLEEIPVGFTNLLEEIADLIDGVEYLESVVEPEDESDETPVKPSKSVKTKTKKTKSTGKSEAAEKKYKMKTGGNTMAQTMDLASEDDEDDDLVIPEFVSLKETSNPKGKAGKSKKAKKAADDDDLGDEELTAVDLIDKARRKRDLKFHVTRIDQVCDAYQIV